MDLKYNDKLNDEDRKRIDGLYNSQHPPVKKILPKPVRPTVEPPKPSEPMDPPLLTIREVSEYLQVSRLTLKRYEKRGKIKSIRINSRGDRRYLREEIQRFIGES